MNIGQIIKADVANGEGIRLSIFVSGCTNRCKGCFNPQTCDFDYGVPFTKELQEEFLSEAGMPYYKGISILGGEPTEPCNQYGLLPLVKEFKAQNPGKTVWMYTGNVYEDLLPGGKRYAPVTDELLSYIDILVDGPFIEDLKDIRLRFRGSSNQRVIDVKKSRQNGILTLYLE